MIANVRADRVLYLSITIGKALNELLFMFISWKVYCKSLLTDVLVVWVCDSHTYVNISFIYLGTEASCPSTEASCHVYISNHSKCFQMSIYFHTWTTVLQYGVIDPLSMVFCLHRNELPCTILDVRGRAIRETENKNCILLAKLGWMNLLNSSNGFQKFKQSCSPSIWQVCSIMLTIRLIPATVSEHISKVIYKYQLEYTKWCL